MKGRSGHRLLIGKEDNEATGKPLSRTEHVHVDDLAQSLTWYQSHTSKTRGQSFHMLMGWQFPSFIQPQLADQDGIGTFLIFNPNLTGSQNLAVTTGGVEFWMFWRARWEQVLH